ncbi:uncharacterized protein LOC130267270 isoform X2 [Hyla sarda]|nr:uncharacterized protein LOC130267270 isoform X2 [Hyla sarda]XP_056372710.1 uncharacterized protein LOC130267270 isoform X2 [Hyla sarda]
MPEGTNNHLNQLRRTVLKDIKNDPSGNSGLKRPLGSLKRRISDSACLSSLQRESRLEKGDKAKERDCGLSSAMSEKNKNIYTDITNTPMTFQDKERNKGVPCEMEISLQSISKDTDVIASPAFRNEMLPMSHKAQLSSPDSCLSSSILGMSDMSLPYFVDSTGHKKSEQDIAEFSTINSDKYFSTPMPSKERVKNKKLTPVMEIESDSSISEEPQHQEKVSITDMLNENSADVVSHESPTQTPLYRSFFAAECQEIAKQIEGIKPDVKQSPAKRKSDELDVSTIDAEPPPYDCTPMKSMLACEVAKMLCSLESSPNKEELSLFGDSILDLEKTDMQISYFTSPKCDIESNKRHSASDAEQLSLSDSGYNIHPKRQKIESFEKINLEVNVNLVNKMSPLANVDSFTSVEPTVDSLHISTTTKCSEGLKAVFSNSVILPEHKLLDSVVEPALLMKDTAITPLALSPVYEGAIVTRIKHLFQTSEHKLCANTTQDNVLNHDELLPTDTNRVIDSSNTRPSSTSKHEMTRVPHAFNTTQDILFNQEEINRTNTTQVIEMVGTQSFSTTLDIVQVHDDATSGNTTQVLDVVPPSANTTQDIAPVHNDAVLSNTTQVRDVAPLSANLTQDVSSVHDAISGNTTQVIDAPLSTDTTQVMDAPLSTNTTQDVASVHHEATSSNTTQVMDVAPLSANLTQDVSPVHDEISGNTTQVMDAPLATNTTQVMDAPLATNTTQVMDAPLATNTTQVMDAALATNTTQVMDAPLATNTTQVMDAPLATNTTQVMDAPLATNTTQVMDAPLATNTTQDITPIQEVGLTANTTQIIEEESKMPVNNTVVPSMHEGKTSNTTYGTEMEMQPCVNTTQNIVSVNDTLLTACKTQDNEIALQSSANRSFGATSSSHKITTGSSQDTGVMQNSLMEVLPAEEAIHTHSTDAAPEPLSNNNLSHDERTSTNNDHLLKDVTHTSLSSAFKVSSQCSVRISDTNLPGTTGTNTEISTSNYGSDLNAENIENLVITNNQKNVSRLDPTQETLVVNEIKEWPSEPEAKSSHSDLTCVTPDFSPPALVKPNGTERQHIGHLKSSDCCTAMASSRKEADFCKESGNRPLLSESCSMIQEEENVHDVSVFSVGSLSFVTSTPVTGLNNFQFQNSCRDSVQHDSNVSIGLILDDSSNKVPGEQRMIPQQRCHAANRLDCKDKAKQETSRVSFLPPNMQKKNMVPPSEAGPKQMPLSAIPSARRSLALYQNASHNPVRETQLSKIAPRSGIPGRGMIRPPLARQNLPRATLGNAKQGPDSTGGSIITNKLAENRFRTPSAAVVKAKSVTTHSQLPAAPSSIKPPSRIGAPGTTGRVSIGIQNAVPDQHDTPRGDTVLAAQPPMSTGIRTGPPRPVMSSVRLPPQQLQKASLKPKSQVQGLPTKKTQRELPTLGSRKESALKPESTNVVKSNAKQTNLTLDSTKQAASFQAEMAEGKPERCRHLEMSKCCQLLKAYEDFKRHYELAKSELERCQHLEGCRCCQLLKMYEDFKRLFGQVEMTNVADT